MRIKKILRKFYNLLILVQNKPFYGAYGMGTVIKKPLIISPKRDIYLGRNCFIREFARIEILHKWRGSPLLRAWGGGKIIIESGCSFEQGLHMTCANEIIIHKNCSFAPYCCVTDIEHSYEDITNPVKSSPLVIRKTEIGEDCFFGTGTKIVKGVTIGKHCITGAGSVITKNIPDYSVVAGCPARVIRRYNPQKNIWEKSE